MELTTVLLYILQFMILCSEVVVTAVHEILEIDELSKRNPNKL
jgi:hypothetical protein